MKRIICAARRRWRWQPRRPAMPRNAIVTYKSLAPDVAFDLARAALQQCRKDGFQVAVVVIDRFGAPLVMLRDRFTGMAAPRGGHPQGLDRRELHRATPASWRKPQGGRVEPGTRQLSQGTLFAAGGLVIEAGGSLLGGVGVAGAPGGDKDEACAKAGLASIQDKLDF